MNQQPDKLFREKLEGYGKTVPASAWNRVATGLNKKKNNRLWLKVAASLLVLAVAAIWLWPSAHIDQLQHRVVQNSHKEKPEVLKEEKRPVEKSVLKPEKKSEPPVAASKKITTTRAKNKTEKNNAPAVAIRHENAIAMEALSDIASQEKVSVMDEEVIATTTETSVAHNNVHEGQSGVTLVYTVEEVNEKYLDKKSLAEATSANKKPSTLKKLLNKAYDLKHNQDPFGDLRQKKNEILALNFRSEKQRGQNK